MAEALLGLPPSYGDVASNKPSIAHPDDLAAQLRRDLETKKTPTRCEHISVTLDVPPTVEFVIHEGDNDAQENIDPALGGFRSQVVEGQPVRVVRAYDTIINQPHDNPAMQRVVTKHIMGLLSTVDESTWVVREVSRGQFGWTFTYICKDSVAMWNRQNGKAASKSLIGEYSQKDLDPIASGRPAFDCRGTVTIAFSKNSRAITIKYEHTPLHKTVGEMIAHFRPLPPAPPPAPLIPTVDRPKKTPRKRKSGLDGDGTPSQPKKKRKNKADAAAGTSEMAQDGATPAVASGGETIATVPTKADAAVQSGVHSHAVLDVPPAEAARRREVAIRLLSDSGVDPESLSTEQFSIFANQSPDLQKESLSMLAKYGAERLRIVHPSDAAASSSSTSASPAPQQTTAQANVAAPTEASETPASGKKKRSRNSKTAGQDVNADEELTPAPAGTPIKQISRGSCITCRRRKTKCDRGKPTCSSCAGRGVECQYPLVQRQAPRKKEEVSAAHIEDGDVAEAEAEPAAALEPEVEPEEQEPDDIETIDYTSNMPVANMLTPAAQAPSPDYFSSGLNKLADAQDTSDDLSMSQGVSSYPEPSATVTYTEQQGTTAGHLHPSITGLANYAQPSTDTANYVQPTGNENLSYTQPAAVKSPRAARNSTTSTPRHSLPSGQPQHSVGEDSTSLSGYAQNWQSTSTAEEPNVASPPLNARQHRSRKSAQTPTPVTVTPQQTSYDDAQHTAARANLHQHQQQHRPSPTPQAAKSAPPAQVSAFQAPAQAARTQSRAGQRAPTRTPVNQSRATPSHHAVQPASQGTMGTTMYNDSNPLTNVANYSAYNTKYSNASSNSADTNTRIAYQPYTAQTTSENGSNYASYEYERSSARPQTQNTSLSYTPSNSGQSGQWSNTQPRNTQSYANNATPAAASYTQPSPTAQQQSSSLQSFNVRASAPTNETKTSSTKYSNPQQQPQQTQSYGSYPSQTQQQSTQADQQHNWYGFGSTSNTFPAANVSGDYATRNSAPANYGNGPGAANQPYQQQQQHNQGALNITGHNYSGGDNDIYDLLKNSLHGSDR